MGSLHMRSWRRRKDGAPRVSRKAVLLGLLLVLLAAFTGSIVVGLWLWWGTWGPGLVYAGAVGTVLVVRADVL